MVPVPLLHPTHANSTNSARTGRFRLIVATRSHGGFFEPEVRRDYGADEAALRH